MTVRDGRIPWWAAGIGLGVLLIGLGVFLLRAGLSDADRRASVFGVFLNVAGLAVAVHSTVSNRIDGGTFSGPVILGRDMHGMVLPPLGGQAGVPSGQQEQAR